MRNYLIALLLGLLLIGVILYLAPKFIKKSNPTDLSPTITSPSSSSSLISKGDVPQIPFKLPGNFEIRVFASNLNGPRDLQLSPGGTLLVSSPVSNQVIALPDKNNDGVADEKKVIINNENHVHGLAFFGNKLFTAGVTKVSRFNWDEEKLEATLDQALFSLPANGNHNNRTITFNDNGEMFISLGSTCNVCNEPASRGGSVLKSNSNGDNPQVFATGLRNAAFIKINPKTRELWGTEMGRDNLGDNLPPDEVNIIRQSNNYGWPNCFGNKIVDTNFNPTASTNLCQNTQPPIFEIPAHNAPLGLEFIRSPQFRDDWQGDLLVALHGSWNRSVPDGYKIVHLKVSGDQILKSEDFLTGFLENKQVFARPVDLTFNSSGDLFISDDKSGNIFIIQKKN